ncbi:MAG: MATE family efflux transporter [Christensenella sp.]|uniref:MATE family efflux transporter n=1 Tax=Christensenella sp. TaxID=1935934 RepID=UPI002B214213|nr:MATE family efflux transporter [Christensenella sp.]MEA5003585.1 MATE family efflux transporter [Christensenella sp.]
MVERIKLKSNNKPLFRWFLSLAVPVGLQNLLIYSVALMDSIMVGSLGEVQLSAVTIANQTFFLLMVCIYGLATGASVLISQYWGEKDTHTIAKVFGMVLRLSLLAGTVAAVSVIAAPYQVMAMYTNDQQVIEYGAQYLPLVGISFLPYAFTNTYLTCVRSVERVKIAVITYSISFAVNVFFNYVFIFGKFGAPAMGVAGAAIGTVIARLSELAIVLVYAKREKRVKLSFKCLVQNDKLLWKDYLRYALPVVINEMAWSIGMSVQTSVLGHMGVTAVTTVGIISTVMRVTTIFVYGSASATLVIVGKYIGEQQYDTVRKSAKTLVWANVLIAGISAGALLLLKNVFMGLYVLTPETYAALDATMYVAAFIVVMQAIGLSCVVGVFRGGGDTMFCMILDVVTMWAIALPLGALGGFVWNLSIPVVFLLLRFDEVVKVFFCLWRLKGGKWLNNVTRENKDALADC